MTDLKNYAEALFLIAEEDGCLESVKDELYTATKVIKDNHEYAKILDTPALPKDKRLRLVDEAFFSLSENVKNLIKILTEKRETHGLPKLYKDFVALYNNKMRIVPVEVISAVELSAGQKDRLAKKLRNKLSANVVINNTVVPSILGGIILRYDSVQLDGSVKARLDKLSEALRAATI